MPKQVFLLAFALYAASSGAVAQDSERVAGHWWCETELGTFDFGDGDPLDWRLGQFVHHSANGHAVWESRATLEKAGFPEIAIVMVGESSIEFQGNGGTETIVGNPSVTLETNKRGTLGKEMTAELRKALVNGESSRFETVEITADRWVSRDIDEESAEVATQACRRLAGPPAQRTTIERMMAITGTGELGQQTIERVLEMTDLPEAVRKDVIRAVDPAEFADAFVTFYRVNLTEQEASAINAFYETPAGRKLIGLVPRVSAYSIQLSTKWSERVLEAVMRHMGTQ